jgi:hypothetical protein
MNKPLNELSLMFGAIAAACLAAGAGAPAQPEKPAPPAPAPAPAPAQPAEEKPPAPQPPDALPDLDDLLGLSGTPGEKPADPLDPSRKDLDRLLSGAEVGDAFKQAAALMGDAAERLVKARDTGIVTQRVQEDVVRRLDQLISSLENLAQQSASSSSSQSQGEQRRPVPNQQARNRQQAGQGENRGENEPPAMQEGQLKPGMEVVRSAWGQLPERIRDLLVQGSSDRFSSRWNELTKAYYRKLAEENSK